MKRRYRRRQTPEQAAVNKLTRRERKAWRLAGYPASLEAILAFSGAHVAEEQRRAAEPRAISPALIIKSYEDHKPTPFSMFGSIASDGVLIAPGLVGAALIEAASLSTYEGELKCLKLTSENQPLPNE